MRWGRVIGDNLIVESWVNREVGNDEKLERGGR